MANTIFGYVNSDNRSEKTQAGKVWFEDAYADTVTGTEFGALRILSSPKPTSFQLYLEQPNDQEHHWGTDEHKIRGYKMYWHSKQDWRHPENKNLLKAKTHKELIQMAFEEKNTQFTLGEVLKAGSKFLGRIRFENLTEQELGALLFVLDLPEDCAHKLGMGKPLGLGSVKITSTLTIIDRQKRYSYLFNENSEWESGKLNEGDLKQFKDAFARYIGEKLPNPDIVDADSYWARDERMQELKHMLNLEHDMGNENVDWNARTRYMEIERRENGRKVNEYKHRPVLPKPSEVVKPNTYKKP
jgi:CRISPR-associated protein (TIGR03986 family)